MLYQSNECREVGREIKKREEKRKESENKKREINGERKRKGETYSKRPHQLGNAIQRKFYGIKWKLKRSWGKDKMEIEGVGRGGRG